MRRRFTSDGSYLPRWMLPVVMWLASFWTWFLYLVVVDRVACKAGAIALIPQVVFCIGARRTHKKLIFREAVLIVTTVYCIGAIITYILSEQYGVITINKFICSIFMPALVPSSYYVWKSIYR